MPLLVDRGLASAEVIDLCHALGGHYVLRLSVAAQQGVPVRLPDGTVGPAWDRGPGKGQRWHGAVATFQGQGWRAAHLTIVRPARYTQPWLLLSDRLAGADRVRAERRRAQAEASYQDSTARGWQLEASTLTERNRLNRLLLALFLALWWCHLLGQRVIRGGHRRHFDRPKRRELRVFRVGRRWFAARLAHGSLPPLPFRYHVQEWRCRWSY